MADADPRLAIGGNSPPPLETWRLHIEDLMAEAEGFLDGDPILSQAQADSIGKLLGMLREARKGADTQRAVEKKPHDDAAKAVQSAWKPLLDRCELAESTAKKALAPFLAIEEARKDEEARLARVEAERAAQAAREALQAADASNLAARESAERLAKEAEIADRVANKAEKAKPLAAGLGRAVGLRSVWTAVLSDSAAALRYYREHQPEALKAWLTEQAQRDVNAGARAISGFTITESRIAQ